tara:strand:+ start:1051 stop:1995 length:945 start_codon:yes stop_codon:yes gene_type:complete
MIYNFVTVFNSLYLPQALALHSSLKKFQINFKLWAICIDNESYQFIKKLPDKSIKAVNFSKYESKQLLKLKKERSVAEYCWTITPITPKIIFKIDKKIKSVTYVDADMFFLNNPKILINKFINGNKKVLFTNHNFNSKEKFKEKIYGKFCVQFMTFKKNGSEKIRKIWEKKCLNWCFAIPDKGRMGDQKYLDNIYKNFKNKIFIAPDQLFSATWNYQKINYKKIIAWHFHGFKIINKQLFLMHHLKFLPRKIKKKIYVPYIHSITRGINKAMFNKSQFTNKNIYLILINKIKFKLIEFGIFKKDRYWSIINKNN